MDLYELLIRTSLGYIVLFVLARIMGRKEISQMTFFNFVSAIAIGSICANFVLSNDVSIRNGVLSLVGWAIFTLAMDYIDIKSKKARKVTTGDPIIVIKDGKIVERALRKSRLDLDSMNAMLRQKNVFSIADVNYAIFETNGTLSVMLKDALKPVTKGDMHLTNTKQPMFPIATEIIMDGKIVKPNLTKLRLTEDWLGHQLSQAGVDALSDVFYAEVQQDGTLYIDKKERLH